MHSTEQSGAENDADDEATDNIKRRVNVCLYECVKVVCVCEFTMALKLKKKSTCWSVGIGCLRVGRMDAMMACDLVNVYIVHSMWTCVSFALDT